MHSLTLLLPSETCTNTFLTHQFVFLFSAQHGNQVTISISLLSKTKQQIIEDNFDVDVSMDIEASTNDAEAIQMLIVIDFDPGDVIGKLMAFISQLQQCSEDTRDYLKHLAISYGCPPLEIKIWVHTRWRSLSNCFHIVLLLQKVCFSFIIMLNFFNTLFISAY